MRRRPIRVWINRTEVQELVRGLEDKSLTTSMVRDRLERLAIRFEKPSGPFVQIPLPGPPVGDRKRWRLWLLMWLELRSPTWMGSDDVRVRKSEQSLELAMHLSGLIQAYQRGARVDGNWLSYLQRGMRALGWKPQEVEPARAWLV